MKIQPQDLRINDYVLYEGRIVRIYSITKVFSPIGYECAVYLEYKGIMRAPINALQPIPLTEELLLKCGFEVLYVLKGIKRIKEPIGVYINLIDMGYKKLSIDYSFSNFNTKEYSMVLNTSSEGMYTEFKLNIQYLNQLQNLYWCLCNKELKLVL